MTKDKRKFIASICVKNGTERARFELAKAEEYNGSAGLYRVRKNRVWLDYDNSARFLDAQKIGELVAGSLNNNSQLPDKPEISKGMSVTYTEWRGDWPYEERTFTGTEPILDYNGVWQVWVILADGSKFVPCSMLKPCERRRNVKS